MSTPELISPSKNSSQTEKQQPKSYSASLVYILAGIIICLLIILIALLFSPASEQVVSYTSLEKSGEIKISEKKKTIASDEPINEKIQIDWLIKKTEAETARLTIWAQKNYLRALALAKEAENLKLEKKYQLSEKKFRLAISQIDETLSNKDIIFKNLVRQADSLFIEEKLTQANELYLQAQAINKNDNEISRKIARIDTRDKVNTLYYSSMEKEKNEQFKQAIELIIQARSIEPEYVKLKNKLTELESEKLKKEFNESISSLLEALENKNFSRAKKKLEIARKINASEPIITEMTQRLSAAINQNKIFVFLKKGAEQEKKELWQQANISYNKILAIEPYESQALVNKRRVEAFLHYNKLLDVIIAKPERLQNDKVLRKSKKSLQFVLTELKHKSELLFNKDKQPGLIKKISIVEQIIKNVSVKVKVKISSDNETDVSLYKVGKFGKLLEKNIELRPGKYTIVGSRSGYRDYRKTFIVSGSDELIEIIVQCRDKI